MDHPAAWSIPPPRFTSSVSRPDCPSARDNFLRYLGSFFIIPGFQDRILWARHYGGCDRSQVTNSKTERSVVLRNLKKEWKFARLEGLRNELAMGTIWRMVDGARKSGRTLTKTNFDREQRPNNHTTRSYKFSAPGIHEPLLIESRKRRGLDRNRKASIPYCPQARRQNGISPGASRPCPGTQPAWPCRPAPCPRACIKIMTLSVSFFQDSP